MKINYKRKYYRLYILFSLVLWFASYMWGTNKALKRDIKIYENYIKNSKKENIEIWFNLDTVIRKI